MEDCRILRLLQPKTVAHTPGTLTQSPHLYFSLAKLETRVLFYKSCLLYTVSLSILNILVYVFTKISSFFVLKQAFSTQIVPSFLFLMYVFKVNWVFH